MLTNANNALMGQVAAIGKLGMWRIAAGVASLLTERQPPTARLDAIPRLHPNKEQGEEGSVLALPLVLLQRRSYVALHRRFYSCKS